MYYACCCLKINPFCYIFSDLEALFGIFRWLYKHFFNVKLLRVHASFIHIHYKAISISCSLLVMPYKNYKTTPYCICPCSSTVYGSRIHERTISLRFRGIILRVLRLDVSIYLQCLYYKPVSNHICSRGVGSKIC
jgi:hypothetical protein